MRRRRLRAAPARLAQPVFIDAENMGLRAHVAFPAAA